MNSKYIHLITGGLLSIAVVVACSLSPAGPATSQAAGSGACVNAYFPITPGNSWSFSSSGGALGDYTYSMTVDSLGVNYFATTETSSLGTGTRSTIRWKCLNGNLAALDVGAGSLSMATPRVKMTSTSVSSQGYTIPNTLDAGTNWSERVLIKGAVVSGGRTIDSQIASQLNCNMAGDETITVPAGTFKTVRVTCNQTVGVSMLTPAGTAVPSRAPVKLSITDWYAMGVGLVQSVRFSAGNTATIVLTQYKVQ
ncbi:MAG: hypothetical protein WCE68_09830 [Anaerolineales bacterium]